MSPVAVEHHRERQFDAPPLLRGEVPDQVTSRGVDRAGLLNEHSGQRPVDVEPESATAKRTGRVGRAERVRRGRRAGR